MGKPFYQSDLSYIHDRHYGALAEAAVQVIGNLPLEPGNTAVDLGCGSGILLERLAKRGLRGYGVDISVAMIQLANNRVPTAQFETQSLYRYSIPKAHLVTAIGECFNYLSAPDSPNPPLRSIFETIHQALVPKGYFLFDVAEPGLAGRQGYYARMIEKEDYTIFLEVKEKNGFLNREISLFTKEGTKYRRSKESHWLQLYSAQKIKDQLLEIGFKVKHLNHYGDLKLRDKHIAFLAQKM